MHLVTSITGNRSNVGRGASSMQDVAEDACERSPRGMQDKGLFNP